MDCCYYYHHVYTYIFHMWVSGGWFILVILCLPEHVVDKLIIIILMLFIEIREPFQNDRIPCTNDTYTQLFSYLIY